jgi:NAD(P)-dependent dehydrogenase (short-subunit alcohol dehydrogenase family)
MGDLDGKVALVTGGGSGIGKAIATAFAGAGATVVIAARNQARLDEAAAEIDGTVEVAVCDVTDEGQVEGLFAGIDERHGRLDILVNNAGMSVPIKTHEMSAATWREVVEVNLTAPFLCSREAFKRMMPAKRGRIINIGSISAQVPRPHSAPYTATKFGLEGLTRSLALDGRDHGIAVGILHPGNVATDIWIGREAIAKAEGLIPLADIGKAALSIATMSDAVNVLDTIIMPVTQPYVGRG